MKFVLLFAALSITLMFCDTPGNITGNPDNHTTTSGTVGSAKMNSEMPTRSDTLPATKDTIRQNR